MSILSKGGAFWTLIAIFLLSACSNTKFLSEDERLYTGADFNINSRHPIPDKSHLKTQVNQVIRPEPNNTFLGLRPGLWLFHIAGEPKKDKGIRHFIKYRMGQAPVLYEDVEPEFVTKLIDNRLNNHGFFHASTEYEVDRGKKKKVALEYTARVQKPYRYDSIFYRLDTHINGKAINGIRKESLLESGDQYNLQVLRDERERIERELKNRGFYYFDRDYLRIEADTTGSGSDRDASEIDLFLGFQDDMPEKAIRAYRMNDIYIYPDYRLGAPDTGITEDTVHYDGYIIADMGEQADFRPRALADKVNFTKGRLYSRDAHDFTIRRTMGTGAFKYVDVRLRETGPGDSSLLDAFVYMTPLPKKTISAQLALVSKSNNYAGPGLELTWLNRNIFGGAELLKIQADGGIETQIGGATEDAFSDFRSYQFGTNIELSVPRFLIPFSRIVGRKYSPKTRFGLGYEYVNRLQYFQLSSFSFTSGYLWNESDEKLHELYPLVIRYLALDEVTDAFQMILDENPFLRRSFSEQYMLGPDYTYTFNNQVNPDVENHIYLTASGSFSNPFDLISGEISTFYRLSADFRYYYRLSRSSKLITRLAGGVGIPYGGSESLPYIKQFFTGGPNSIRAFRARTVGPGSTSPPRDEERFGFQDRNGNIKLEFNLEYRFDIYGIFKGALFTDVGNIWLHQEDPVRPGGVFEAGDFLDELAVGTGLGLRMDISYFVLRFDLAWPVRKPYLPEGERWVQPFRGQHPVLNIAIGYPF